MNKQEIFNIVYTHLLKQGVKSIVDEGGINETCVYRGPNGTKCAAGALIPDSVYSSDMESSLIRCVVTKFHGLENISSEINFVQELQNIHDHQNVADWQENLEELAKHYALTVPEIN